MARNTLTAKSIKCCAIFVAYWIGIRGNGEANIMVKQAIVVATWLISGQVFAQDTEQPFSSTFGQNGLACRPGLEIKDERLIKAPEGRYFSEVKVEEISPIQSYAGGDIGCLDRGRETTNVAGQIAGRNVSVPVPTGVAVFAHADCGSGDLTIFSNRSISAYCRIVGKTLPLR